MKTYYIDTVSPSQNEIDRMHWTQRSKLKDEHYWLVKAAAGWKEQSETKPVRLHIVRVSKRLIDDANVPSGCKYIIDAFVAYGHAKDDSRKWMRVTFDQRKCEDEEDAHMEVTLSSHLCLP